MSVTINITEGRVNNGVVEPDLTSIVPHKYALHLNILSKFYDRKSYGVTMTFLQSLTGQRNSRADYHSIILIKMPFLDQTYMFKTQLFPSNIN